MPVPRGGCLKSSRNLQDSTGSGETHGEKGPAVRGRVSGRPRVAFLRQKMRSIATDGGISPAKRMGCVVSFFGCCASDLQDFGEDCKQQSSSVDDLCFSGIWLDEFLRFL